MNVLLVESKMSDCTVVLRDGTKIDVNSYDLFNEDLYHFKGWTCAAGTDGILIESDFQVPKGLNNDGRASTDSLRGVNKKKLKTKSHHPFY